MCIERESHRFRNSCVRKTNPSKGIEDGSIRRERLRPLRPASSTGAGLRKTSLILSDVASYTPYVVVAWLMFHSEDGYVELKRAAPPGRLWVRRVPEAWRFMASWMRGCLCQGVGQSPHSSRSGCIERVSPLPNSSTSCSRPFHSALYYYLSAIRSHVNHYQDTSAEGLQSMLACRRWDLCVLTNLHSPRSILTQS